MKNKNFEKYYDELAQWMEGNDYNGGLEYAFRNDFQLHAVSLWMGTGASQLDLPLKINRRDEMKEIKELCNSADIFVCPDCNHHSFFQAGEISDDETRCESCHKPMKIHSRGK